MVTSGRVQNRMPGFVELAEERAKNVKCFLTSVLSSNSEKCQKESLDTKFYQTKLGSGNQSSLLQQVYCILKFNTCESKQILPNF